MSLGTANTRLDVRAIATRERHSAIFTTFNDLEVGAALKIVSDHDPRPLYCQFKAQLQGNILVDLREERAGCVARDYQGAGATPKRGRMLRRMWWHLTIESRNYFAKHFDAN